MNSESRLLRGIRAKHLRQSPYPKDIHWKAFLARDDIYSGCFALSFYKEGEKSEDDLLKILDRSAKTSSELVEQFCAFDISEIERAIPNSWWIEDPTDSTHLILAFPLDSDHKYVAQLLRDMGERINK